MTAALMRITVCIPNTHNDCCRTAAASAPLSLRERQTATAKKKKLETRRIFFFVKKTSIFSQETSPLENACFDKTKTPKHFARAPGALGPRSIQTASRHYTLIRTVNLCGGFVLGA